MTFSQRLASCGEARQSCVILQDLVRFDCDMTSNTAAAAVQTTAAHIRQQLASSSRLECLHHLLHRYQCRVLAGRQYVCNEDSRTSVGALDPHPAVAADGHLELKGETVQLPQHAAVVPQQTA